MFKRMPLKRVLGEVDKLDNATEERSISHIVKTTYCPFWDIAELGELCLIGNMQIILRLFFVLVSLTRLSTAQTITETFGTGVNQFSIEFVNIGNPGNTADTTGFGAVSYTYNLGKYEINRDIINKANLIGGLGITMPTMTTIWGNDRPNNPATGISWNEAARFVNMLNTLKGYHIAYNFLTSDPNSNISIWNNGEYNGNNQFRHKDSFYFLPSVDEWYKGAYGDPSGQWHKYATGSSNIPTAVSQGSVEGTVVYNQAASVGPAEITNAGGLSAYGTMAQNGNVFEWTESSYDGINNVANDVRELRGGGLSSSVTDLDSSWRLSLPPDLTLNTEDGFRVAMVPEPSALSLFAIGLSALALMGRRRS